ncbi:MAG: hypothetical protein ACPG77_04725 [Nannocystaceae bacterium]
MRLQLVIPIFLAFLATGCGDTVDEWLSSRNGSEAVRCSCNWQVLGYASESTCTEQNEVTEKEAECTHRVLRDETSPEATEGILNCRIDSETAFQECLTTETCTDLAHVSCMQDYLRDLQSCPQFSDTIDAALLKCM